MAKCKNHNQKVMIHLGELRGKYLSLCRSRAFEKHYGTTPQFNILKFDKNGKEIDSDFILADRLIDKKAAYDDFQKLIDLFCQAFDLKFLAECNQKLRHNTYI